MGTFDHFSLIHDVIFHREFPLAKANYRLQNHESKRKKNRQKEFCLLCQNQPTSSCLFDNNVRREIFLIHIDEWLGACVVHKPDHISAVFSFSSPKAKNFHIDFLLDGLDFDQKPIELP